MLFSKSLKVIAISLILFSFANCGKEKNEISQLKKPPQRVISLAPGFTETLIDLGLQNRIVGVTTSSDYLKEVKEVERIGLYMKPSLEKIVSLSPDLVFATNYVGQRQTVKTLKKLGIRVEVFEEKGIEGVFLKVKRIGEICGVPEEARRIIRKMQKRIEQIRAQTSSFNQLCVYVETGYNPLFTCGKGSFIDELIEIAGGENIAHNIDKPYPRVSAEFIISKDPEVIILPYMGRGYGKETLKRRKGWQRISAVLNGRIYDDIGSQIITIPSSNLVIKGLPELAKRIHPEIFGK
ncbi:MAG: cobalamin-binding protein [Candidatus Omnitrophica bacterium]|nr:cobalamin-binding protein [Candidatus Omnitrophota bacterium]